LATGDEANAVREAVRAVNLMTVHASKGLEFPIVFLVNIGRGVARRRSPVRVHLSGDEEEGGTASVSVENFLSEQDTLEPELEREETKRLLYVALTRARDRLYLSAAAKDGAVRFGPGSLGQALPPPLQQAIAAALPAGDGARVPWTGRSATHVLRVARPDAGPAPAVAPPAGVGEAIDTADVGPRLEPPLPRVAVTAGDDADLPGADGVQGEEGEPAGGRLVGRLVHRLLARFPPGTEAPPAAVSAAADRLVTDDERASMPDPGAVVARAAALHARLASRPDVVALFAEGPATFEVPVSLLEDGRVLRGTVDCLIRRPDGSLIVVEVKTGPPRPSHLRQLETYVAAIQRLGPAIRATGRLVHP
jgi:ATP-dependent helicase/nuclease subunit A